MFQTLYKKCLGLAAHKSSNYYLGLVSFIESSFFPIPPDVMIIPMVIAKKKEFIKIFLIASIFSVLGGILGYLIGYLFFDLAMYVIDFYNYGDKVKNLKFSLSEGNGFLAWLSILFLAGFTPLPYKIFTLAAGTFKIDFPTFVLASAISRSARFFLVGFIIYKFGPPIKIVIEKYFNLFSIVFFILLVLGFYLLKFVL